MFLQLLYVCTEYSAFGSQKRWSNPLQLTLWMVVSWDEAAEDQIGVLWPSAMV